MAPEKHGDVQAGTGGVAAAPSLRPGSGPQLTPVAWCSEDRAGSQETGF